MAPEYLKRYEVPLGMCLLLHNFFSLKTFLFDSGIHVLKPTKMRNDHTNAKIFLENTKPARYLEYCQKTVILIAK